MAFTRNVAPAPRAGASVESSRGGRIVSVVIPVHDEEENVAPLHESLTRILRDVGDYEIVVVDDGSRDGTYQRLTELAAHDPALKLVKLRRNFGQTAAMAAGFDYARGDVIVPMDGDLQNDPVDIPRLLAKIDEGFDVVSGWRKDRQDSALVRRLPSIVANHLISAVTGVRLHDYGCTLKAYRADVVRELRLYGEMHRFLPALAERAGARITEIPVRHHARRFGRSKYGLRRTLKVLLDLLTVKFLSSYATNPSYVFGGSGVILCIGGVAAAGYTAYEKWVHGIYAYRQPSLLVAVFLLIIGINLILMGLLAELITRTYHESQGKATYSVRETQNLKQTDD